MGLQGALFYNDRLYILASGISVSSQSSEKTTTKQQRSIWSPWICVKMLFGDQKTLFHHHLTNSPESEGQNQTNLVLHLCLLHCTALPLSANCIHDSPAMLLLVWKPLLQYHLNLYLACNSLLWQAHFHRTSLGPTVNLPFGRTIKVPFFHATLNTCIPCFISSITNILSCFSISETGPC